MAGRNLDMRSKAVYQIDCEVSNKGRRFASTKRRVCWRFGFPLLDAIQNGFSGIDCRGEEHEVVLIASLTSGKQRILADGHEVHFARSPLNEKFECGWTMNGGHEIKVVGSASSALFVNQAVHRQFDLIIDGLPFDKMPKIFQLGKRRALNSYIRVQSTDKVLRSSLPEKNIGVPLSVAHRRTQSLPDFQTADLLGLSSDIFPSDFAPSPSSYQDFLYAPIASPTSVTALVQDLPRQTPGVPHLKGQTCQMHSSLPESLNQSLVTNGGTSMSYVERSLVPYNPFVPSIDFLDNAQGNVSLERALESLVNFGNLSQDLQGSVSRDFWLLESQRQSD